MIWPGRNLALAVLVPSLMSLSLLIPGSGVAWPALVLLDAVIVLAALADLVGLFGATPAAGRADPAGRRVDRRAARRRADDHERGAATAAAPGQGRRARTVRGRAGGVPRPDPAPGDGRVSTIGSRPERRGSFALRRIYGLERSRWGFWQRSRKIACESAVRVYPDVRQIARYTLLATPRPAQRDRPAAVAPGRHWTTTSSGSATTPRGTSPGGSTGGPRPGGGS